MATGHRVRENFIEGTVGNSGGLSDTDTTLEATALANLPAIASGEYAVIVIEDEIVHVTAHTASATSATIQRGQEGTTAVAHSETVAWVHAPTRQDALEGFEPVTVVSSSGTAVTASPETSSVWHVTLTDDCTFTFSTGDEGWSFTLVLVQDATGGRAVTWPGSVLWAGGVAPTLSSGADEIDMLVFYTFDGGTTWLGALAGSNFS